jgi:hypothetical protein
MWDDESTVTGHPVTVLSGKGGRIPREVNLRDGQAESEDMQAINAKPFKNFAVPTWDMSFSTYCFQFIRQRELLSAWHATAPRIPPPCIS